MITFASVSVCMLYLSRIYQVVVADERKVFLLPMLARGCAFGGDGWVGTAMPPMETSV